MKIAMCNYYGMCDKENNVIGHTSKVTQEYGEILNSICEVTLMASPCIANSVIGEVFHKVECLKYDIYIDEPFTLKKRLYDKVKLLKNISECFKKTDAEVLFFYQVDFFFFFYIALLYKQHQRKVYCLIYHQDFTGGRFERILEFFYKNALDKIDGVLYTQREHKINHPNAYWIPDFLYSKERYMQYQRMKKEQKVVCLGTMNRYKQLEKLVEIFAENKYPLEIIGRFDDVSRFEKLRKCNIDTIQIENKVLDTQEYYTKLASAKYSILPYNMEQYQNRTSGVLLESLFVGSIPIAPRMLLEQNHLVGVEYQDIDDLKKMDWENMELDRIESERRKILEDYGIERSVVNIERLFNTR